MKFLKRVLTIVISISLISLQPMYAKAGENNKTDVKIGDKYEKKIVAVNEEEDSSHNLTEEKSQIFIAPKFFTKINDEGTNLKTEQLLVPKTDAKYEIALAYEDGDYTYAGKADTYDEAVKKADEEDKKVKTITSEFVVSVVLDTSSGEINYAKYGIGRCIKNYKFGMPEVRYDKCTMYEDSDLTITDRAIDQNFCSEMPLLDSTSKAAKVYINGYSGWMNMDINRSSCNENGKCSSDVAIQPINQVKDPSFYYADNDGLLYHYISTNMSNEEAKVGAYSAKKIGKAPSYLEKRVKYLSYDGKHFYSIKNRGITRTLYLITENLKAGNFKDSVNENNPYYNYYLYLPFRSRTNYTADELDKYINYYISETNKEDSRLKGIGKALIDNQNKYGVNALIMLGIAINESGGGDSKLVKQTNNIFSLNATDHNTTNNAEVFKTVDDCIEAFCKNYISRGFADINNYTFYGDFLGNKEYGANVKYASDPFWADKAANTMCKIENYLNDKNVSKYKDYDYYQLFKYTKPASVKNKDDRTEYNVNNKFNPCSGEFIGATGILLCNNTLNLKGIECSEIALDRTLQEDNKNNGLYKWFNKGYIDKNSIQLINNGKTNVDKADINKDGIIDETDLAKAASAYNNNDYNLDYMCDVNDDGIVDIYDIVRVSSNL